MTIQKNEVKEIKQSNDEPLIFIKEEKDFIKMSFRITREAFEQELSIDNEKDIREAIRLYHNRYAMPGGRPHQLMRDIFRKMGYWEDGRTTLVERERKLIEQKMANERRLADMNFKRKEALDKQLIAIQQEQEQLANNPIMHKNALREEYVKIEENFKKQLELEKQEQTVKLQQFLREQQEAFEKLAQESFQKAELDKQKLQDKAMREAVVKTKDKLAEAMINVDKVAPIVSTTEAEIIKKIEVIDLELQDLEGKTVAQLRELAKSKDIHWTYNHRKADLVELIKSKLEV